VQVTTFVPTGKTAGALLVMLATAQTSPVTGVPRATLVAPQPELAAVTISAGQVMVGIVGWLTTTSCWQMAMFPLLSVTVQVTRLVPAGKMAGALFVTDATPEQLSVVTGVPSATLVALHPELADTTTLGGQVMAGGVRSRTTTSCWQLAEFPPTSVAVQVTIFVPSGKLAGALLVTVTAQLSVVMGTPSATLVALQPELAATTRFEGQVIVGGVRSRTTTNCWQVAVLPPLFFTVQITTFVPTGKKAGALLVTLATAQTSPVTGTPRATLVATQPELAATRTFAGQVMVGVEGSWAISSCWQKLVFPLLSTTVQVTRLVPEGK